jgi:hypothetical protein
LRVRAVVGAGRGAALPLTQATPTPGAVITQLIKATPTLPVFENCSPPLEMNVELMKATFDADITPEPVGKKISASSQALIVPPPMKSSVPSMNALLK